jgi:hypothetical protein
MDTEKSDVILKIKVEDNMRNYILKRVVIYFSILILCGAAFILFDIQPWSLSLSWTVVTFIICFCTFWTGKPLLNRAVAKIIAKKFSELIDKNAVLDNMRAK